jgi:hypothetical protein
MVVLHLTLIASARCLGVDDPFLGPAPPARIRPAAALRDAGWLLAACPEPELLDEPAVRTLLDRGRAAPS